MAGRQTHIFYDDGDRVSCKSGTLLSHDQTLVTILTVEGKKITIPVARVIRIEELS